MVSASEATARQTYLLDAALVEKLKDVAWWERRTITSLVEDALRAHLSTLEHRRKNPYPRREGELKAGRPATSR